MVAVWGARALLTPAHHCRLDGRVVEIRVLATQACARQGITPFHWLATAHVALRPGSREARLLAQRGLHLPRSKVVI